jgi:hypothetical protein
MNQILLAPGKILAPVRLTLEFYILGGEKLQDEVV